MRSASTKVSATKLTSSVRPASVAPLARAELLRWSRLPPSRALPPSGTTTKEAMARRASWCCSSAAPGTVTSTVSGAAMSYAARGGTVSDRCVAFHRCAMSRLLAAIIHPLSPGTAPTSVWPISASESAAYAAEPGVPASTGQSQPSSARCNTCERERSASSGTTAPTSSPHA